MNQKPILQVRGISKSFYGVTVLRNIDLDVFPGEIHAICGENGAGKTTLMNILTGSFPPDSGDIYFNGEKVVFDSPKDAQQIGISIVHQEISLFPHLTVAENIFAGRVPLSRGDLINKNELNKRAKEVIKELKTNIEPDEIVGDLSISRQQMVEIAKALSSNCKVLILDEPTSALTEAEAENLFNILEILKRNGMAILYISHRMSEIFKICQRITILRDGEHVWTKMISDTTIDEVVSSMVGRKLDNIYPEKGKKGDNVKLEVKGLTRKGVYSDITFKLYEGEILGIFGLMGAGRTEVARGICGIDHVDNGEIYLNGEKIPINNIRSSIDRGLVYVTEDRKNEGLFLEMSIAANIIAANLKQVSKRGLINVNLVTSISEKFRGNMNIKCKTIEQSVITLSGGNQQKVLLSKWLALDPKVLILDEPTRGIDVGAKHEIHEILRNLANQGIGIIVISSELPEILGISDRILVMHQGKIVRELMDKEANEELIMQYATGTKKDIMHL
ncbi:sugar ABC transporter ATP-binding protein [Thermoanaerobacter thermohydrosulfuricus]